jgi:hypothetical protein
MVPMLNKIRTDCACIGVSWDDGTSQFRGAMQDIDRTNSTAPLEP